MTITLNADYEVTLSTALLGYVGETNARPVSVEGLTVDGADRYVLTIDYGDGTVYEVDITGGTWTPTADILRSAQTVSCQIAAKKLSGDEYILVKKSRIFRLRIGAAIGDTAIPSPGVAMDALDRIDAIGRQAHADMQTAVTAAETATTAANNAAKSATATEKSADTATQAASRAETAKTAAETSATQADTAMQGAETARAEAVTAQNAAKVSADQASVSAQQTTADKTATAGYAQTAKTNADSTTADRQAVQTLATQVTADKATVADHAAKVAEDRTAAETAAQTALESVGSVNQLKKDLDYLNSRFEIIKEPLSYTSFLTKEGYINSDGTLVYEEPHYASFSIKYTKNASISIKSDDVTSHKLFRVAIATGNAITERAESGTAQTIVGEEKSSFDVSVGDYVNFTIKKIYGETNETAFSHIAFIDSISGKKYKMPDLILTKEQKEIDGSEFDIPNGYIEKTKIVNSDYVVLSEKSIHDVVVSGDYTLKKRNRFNIAYASFSDISSATLTKTENGIKIVSSDIDSPATLFTRTIYVAERTGKIFVSCNAKCKGYSKDVEMMMWSKGKPGDSCRGIGELAMSLYVEKGTTLWIDFYYREESNKANEIEYSNIQISFDKPYDFRGYITDNVSSAFEQGDCITFESESTVEYKYIEPIVKKKVVCFGDSITGMLRNDTSYPSIMGINNDDLDVINQGYSGCCFTDNGAITTYAPFSFNRLVDAICDRDFTLQDASDKVNSSKSLYDAIYDEHLATLKTIDFATVDFITVFYGTNDWGNNKILLSSEDTSTSNKQRTNVEDAVLYSFDKLISKYPNLRFIVVGPYWRDITNDGEDSNATPNGNGHYLYEFADKIMEWSQKFNVKCINLYRESCASKYTKCLFTYDGTHPTQLMSNQISKKLSDAIRLQ